MFLKRLPTQEEWRSGIEYRCVRRLVTQEKYSPVILSLDTQHTSGPNGPDVYTEGVPPNVSTHTLNSSGGRVY